MAGDEIGRRGRATALVGAVLAIVAAGCGDGATGVDTLPEDELEFVPVRADAPPLETNDTSFWAVAGEDRELRIHFEDEDGTGTGSRFLEFEVDDESLLTRPDGTPFSEGDSILITVTIDPGLYRVAFEPSGLVFNPAEPAELELDYDLADDDALEDEALFAMWRQEEEGEPWTRIQFDRFDDLDDIQASIFSFTRFALAIGR